MAATVAVTASVAVVATVAVSVAASPAAVAQHPWGSGSSKVATPGPWSAWEPWPVRKSWSAWERESGELGQADAFLSSLALPGLAQGRMGQRRWIAYAGLEVLSAFLYFRSRSDALGTRDDYRDFAWEAARASWSTGPRRDGNFDYYETLSQWPLSGAWDADPALPGLQPETDPATYNGSVWVLATEIFGVDPTVPERSPGYARALEYYKERSYGPQFLWAWSGGQPDRIRLGDMIRESDRGFRDARRALWTLAVNHIFSAVDGLVAVRLRSRPGTERVEVTASVRTP